MVILSKLSTISQSRDARFFGAASSTAFLYWLYSTSKSGGKRLVFFFSFSFSFDLLLFGCNYLAQLIIGMNLIGGIFCFISFYSCLRLVLFSKWMNYFRVASDISANTDNSIQQRHESLMCFIAWRVKWFNPSMSSVPNPYSHYIYIYALCYKVYPFTADDSIIFFMAKVGGGTDEGPSKSKWDTSSCHLLHCIMSIIIIVILLKNFLILHMICLERKVFFLWLLIFFFFFLGLLYVIKGKKFVSFHT